MTRIVSTLTWPHLDEWSNRVVTVDSYGLPRREFFQQLQLEASTADVVIINGSIGLEHHYLDLLGAVRLLRDTSGPGVLIADCLWGRGRNRFEYLLRSLGAMALNSERARFCVMASDEIALLNQTWRIPERKIRFTPFHATIGAEELAKQRSDDGFIFAGGDSVRDHDLLIAAAAYTTQPITLAAKGVTARMQERAPENVIAGPVQPHRFNELLRTCRAAVVPLLSDTNRSGGMQTYLNAMVLGKPVIITDCLGARDYVEDGVSGIIVPPDDPRALGRAMDWVADPDNREAVERIARQGQRVASETFTHERYAADLLSQAEDLHRTMIGRSEVHA